jgi:membrane-bound lytic murein transglycosylase B
MKTQRRKIIASLGSMAATSLLPYPLAHAQSARTGQDVVGSAVDDNLRFGWLGRADVQEFIGTVSQRNGLPRAWIEAQFDGLGAQPRALALINPPPPKPGEPPAKRSWAKYRAIHVNGPQILQGREFLRQHQSVFQSVHQRFGVPAQVIAAIIGVETKFGRFTGRFPTLETLVTLAFESPRRAEFFRKELESLLVMGHEGIVVLREVQGSFAGALGLPQFMPSSWRNFAVGFRNPERPNLLTSPQDSIASVGNFLKVHGWQADGQSHSLAIVTNASQARQFIPKKLAPAHTVAQIEAAGIAQAQNLLSAQTPASLIDLPEEDDTTQFWFAANNFFVVTQYNRSYMYAAAVLSLAEALA